MRITFSTPPSYQIVQRPHEKLLQSLSPGRLQIHRRTPATGDFLQMINQEAVQELVELAGLGHARLEVEEGGPVQFDEFCQYLFRARAEFAFLNVRQLAEFFQQLHLEGENGQRLRRVLGKLAQQAGEQFVNLRQRRFGFGRLLDECGAVGGLLQPGQVVAQSFVCLAEDDFAEVVQITAPAARETEIGEVKQIQLAAKWRLGTPRAFGHGGDAAQVRREPLDDEARLGERTGAENEAGCGFGVQGE